MIYVIDHDDSFTHNVVHQFSLFDKVECDNYNKINSLDDLKYNADNEEAFYNFSLIYFKVSKLECLQLSEIKNIRVEFVYTESSDKKHYMVP